MQQAPTQIHWHIILAAGGGQRMGMPKGLLQLHGQSLLEHHLGSTAHLGIQQVVVTGARHAEHIALLARRDVHVVHNADWRSSWPADSLHLALNALALSGGGLVTPVDTPPMRPAVLFALQHATAPAVACAPDGRPGHPVFLDAAIAAIVRTQAPKGGLRTLLNQASRILTDDADVVLDFDHQEDWKRFAARS